MQSITVNGWNLVKVDASEVRRILDVELGERLGYADPLKVQRVIEGLVADGELPGVLRADRTVASGNLRGKGPQERVVPAYYLTEREALQVIAKSRTKTAYKITNEVIDVYLVVKHRTENLLRAQVAGLLERIVELDSPQLRKCEAVKIRHRVNTIAAVRNSDERLSRLVAFRRVDNELRGRVQFQVGNGHRWESFPRHRLGDVFLALDEMEAEDASLRRSLARHAAKTHTQELLKLN